MTNNQNTNTNQRNEFENIKKVQQLMHSNAVVNLGNSMKRAKAKLDSLVASFKQKISAKAQEKQAEEKKVQEPAPVKAEPVNVEAKPEVKPQPVQKPEAQQRLVQKPFEKRDQKPQFDRERKPFGQNGERIRNFADRKPIGNGQNGQRPNGQYQGRPQFGNRPNSVPNQNGERKFGQKPGFKQFNNVPQEKIDASTLAKKDVHQTPKKKAFEHSGEDKKSMNKKALVMRGYVDDDSLYDDGGRMGSKKRSKKQKEETQTVVAPKIDHAVITTDNLTVKMLAEKIGHTVPEIMGKFLLLGMMVNINSNIDFDSASLIASDFGVTLEKKVGKTFEEQLADMYSEETDDEKDLVKRPPVVTVMGHVDHGKTSLLDYIRNTNVISGEAGGITQHIGAYQIKVNGELVTFIDTPGHAAFAAMRERGAKLTDVAILVVAADDGVMPQTKEAIKYIKEAKVPMIVAINKIDLPTANVEKIKEELAKEDVLPEEWGGDTIMVPISAKKGINIDKLLEMVLFVAEYQDLRANPNRDASGSIIEARLDKGMGTVATVLVQNGTLKVGDNVVAGTATGKVRAMINEKGVHVKKALPSTPVAILGLTSVPNAGDQLYVVDEKMSRNIANERTNKERTSMIKSEDLSLDSLMSKIADKNFKDYNVIIKGDVQGSIEALKESLSVIKNEEVKVRCIHGGVGAINENDVMLAEASNAVIIGFNVKPDAKTKASAEKKKVTIKFFRIIYEVIDYVTEEINKMLTPKYREVITGHAEIRALFKASKVGIIAGSYVLDGKISKNSKVRITRNGKQIYEGSIATLQREKNEVKDVSAGFEFGATFAGFSDLQVGDIFEAYAEERI